MSDNQGLSITLSQKISIEHLASVIVDGMYEEEVLDLIEIILELMDSASFKQDVMDVARNYIKV